jgi:Putative DNA-binding domain
MPLLKEDLCDLAHAIVRGKEPTSQIERSYRHYSLANAIEVYRNNYCGNLYDTLVGAYPVTEELVGKDFFRLLARQFIEQHQSCGGNLHHYGTEMADFVAAFDPARRLVYLPDVATLEWACHVAYFAEDAAALNLGQLAELPSEQYPDLILRTDPASQVVSSRYPIAAIWHAHQPGAPSDFHIDLDAGSCNALVSRKDDVVLVSELSDANATWMRSIQAGTPLGFAAESTFERYSDFDVQSALLNLLQKGVLLVR